jgi:hypothetical protein
MIPIWLPPLGPKWTSEEMSSLSSVPTPGTGCGGLQAASLPGVVWENQAWKL